MFLRYFLQYKSTRILKTFMKLFYVFLLYDLFISPCLLTITHSYILPTHPPLVYRNTVNMYPISPLSTLANKILLSLNIEITSYQEDSLFK